MLERPNFDHIKSSNLRAFGVAMQTFWDSYYQDFKGIYKSTQNSDYMFKGTNFYHIKSPNLQAFGAAMQTVWA